MAQTTVILDEETSAILAKLLEEGRYPDPETAANRAFRALRTRNEEHEGQLDLLRGEIERGFQSGVAEGDVVARVRATTGLPPRAVR